MIDPNSDRARDLYAQAHRKYARDNPQSERLSQRGDIVEYGDREFVVLSHDHRQVAAYRIFGKKRLKTISDTEFQQIVILIGVALGVAARHVENNRHDPVALIQALRDTGYTYKDGDDGAIEAVEDISQVCRWAYNQPQADWDAEIMKLRGPLH